MKHLILTVLAIMLMTLVGWGEIVPGEQARASVSAHRREANNNQERHRHHRRHGRRHHHHHTGS
jgi:hypothetical protein